MHFFLVKFTSLKHGSVKQMTFKISAVGFKVKVQNILLPAYISLSKDKMTTETCDLVAFTYLGMRLNICIKNNTINSTQIEIY